MDHEIKLGDLVLWKESDKERTVRLTPEAFYYYTLAPKGHIEIKSL